eukprot:TRINITY_DN14595_c0_g1_i1.p1 TRINITY_DN14595_c0_g1~~TRINITY_DN14595_c0_g1_i1.p1  ORF type:complete len:686 (-),score=140.46 TRINITY_DN14595_c0_g1_i1:150-2207(-)
MEPRGAPQLPLDSLPFSEKWSLVGSPSAGVEAAAAAAQWEDSRPHCRLAGSFKLRVLDEEVARRSCTPTSRANIERGSPLRLWTSPLAGFEIDDDRPSILRQRLEDYRMHHDRWADPRKPQGSRRRTTIGRSPLAWGESLLRRKSVSRRNESCQKSDFTRRAAASKPALEVGFDTSPRWSKAKDNVKAKVVAERNVVLSEFFRWCLDRHGGEEKAWRKIARQATHMEKEPFLAAMKQLKYPGSDIGAAKVFAFLLNCADAKTVSYEDILHGIEGIGVRKTVSRPDCSAGTAAERSRLFSCEGSAADNGGSDGEREEIERAGEEDDEDEEEDDETEDDHATFLNPQEVTDRELAERLQATNPVVAQFMISLLDLFNSLSLAYRAMDLNKNGCLSKTEFVQYVKMLRARSGVPLIEAHIKCVYERMEKENESPLRVEHIMAAWSSQDELVQRVGKFLAKAVHIDRSGEANKQKMYTTAFGLSGRRRAGETVMFRVSFTNFRSALSSLRYEDFHWEDLFARMDTDHSGSLTFPEMRELLQPDTLPATVSVQPLVPLGSEARRRAVRCGHVASSASVKMHTLDGRSGRVEEQSSKLHRSRTEGHLSDFFKTGFKTEKFGLAVFLERQTDLLSTITASLQPRRGRLHHFGKECLTYSKEPLRDFGKDDLAISNFCEVTPRMRLDDLDPSQ